MPNSKPQQLSKLNEAHQMASSHWALGRGGVCVHVCVHVYICMHMCMHMHLCVFICECESVHVEVVCVQNHMCACMYVCICVCLCLSMNRSL